MKTQLLRRVKDAILEEPKRLEMETWVAVGHIGKGAPPCGTVACVAGWVAILARSDSERTPIARAAQSVASAHQGTRWTAMQALNIGSCQANSLFYVAKWPAKYAKQYYRAKTARGRALVTGRRIDAFIESEGKV